MKIVIGVHHFPPDRIGGAELRAYDMALWLIELGHQVHVISVRDVFTGKKNEIQWVDEEYRGINVRRLSLTLCNSDERFEYLYNNRLIEEHFLEYLSQIEPDVFHLISGYLLGAGAFKAAKSLDIPVAITLTDFWFTCPRINMLRPDGTSSSVEKFDPDECAICLMQDKRRFRIIQKLLPKAFHSAANHFLAPQGELKLLADKLQIRHSTLLETLEGAGSLIFPSKFLMDVFEMRGLHRDKMRLIPHGINVRALDDVSRKAARPIRIGYLGQVENHKGVHILIEAFNRAAKKQEMRLSLFGSLSANPEYQSLINQMVQSNPNIDLFGAYAIEKVYEILANLDVVVIPSLWNEVGPLVLYEALQSRVPVIASNIPNMSYEIQNGVNGLLFEVGDVAELAKILAELAANPLKLDEMSRQIQPVRTLSEEMNAIQEEYFRIMAK